MKCLKSPLWNHYESCVERSSVFAVNHLASVLVLLINSRVHAKISEHFWIYHGNLAEMQAVVMPVVVMKLKKSCLVTVQVPWDVTDEQQKECTYKGKNSEVSVNVAVALLK